jgi:hypothetical protein
VERTEKISVCGPSRKKTNIVEFLWYEEDNGNARLDGWFSVDTDTHRID